MSVFPGFNYATIPAKELALAVSDATRCARVYERPYVVQHWCEFLKGEKVQVISAEVHHHAEGESWSFRRLILTVQPDGRVDYAPQGFSGGCA